MALGCVAMIAGDRVAYKNRTALKRARLCKSPPLAYCGRYSGHVMASLQSWTEALASKRGQWGSLHTNQKSSIVILEANGAGWLQNTQQRNNQRTNARDKGVDQLGKCNVNHVFLW